MAAKKQVGKYEIGRTLGEGTFGKVKHAVHVSSRVEVAIKVLDKERIQKQSMGSQIKKEISIMKQLSHENVVKLKEVLASRTKIFIVLELVTGGELFDLIVQRGRLDEAASRIYFRQLVSGVAYCHSQGVAHRDLKPENLLLDSEGTLKISDFGLSALYDGEEGSTRSQMLHTTCGTPNYVAPEVLQNEGYVGRIADCWSIGVILYVLLAGFLPFDEATMSALFDKIKRAEFAYPAHFSDGVKVLIDSLLVADPQKRATLTDVQKDRWFLDQSLSTVATDQVVQPLMRKKSSLKTSKSTRVQSLTSTSSPTQVVEALRSALVASGATLAEDQAPKPEETEDETDDEGPGTRSVEASLQSPSGLLALVATARPSEGGAALDLLRGKGDILAFQAWLQGVLEAVRASGVTLTGPPEP
jgi:serine/threonine protein kinase